MQRCLLLVSLYQGNAHVAFLGRWETISLGKMWVSVFGNMPLAKLCRLEDVETTDRALRCEKAQPSPVLYLLGEM